MSDLLQPIDAFFLATETRKAPWHMAGCEIFEKATGSPKRFVTSLVEKLREQEPVYPFNVRLRQSFLWPSWVPADVDMQFHVQHRVLPVPGTDNQLMEALESFGSATLDRNLPLWECCVFDGLDGGRFAIAFKVHHSLTDGQGGTKLIMNALSLRKSETNVRALWGDNTENDTIPAREKKRKDDSSTPVLAGLELAANVKDEIAKLIRATWSGQLWNMRPFRAPKTVMNKPAQSSARRFGVGDLSLDLMKRVGTANGATINDVLLTCVDAGLHNYLDKHGIEVEKSLVCAMPVSLRRENDKRTSGTQAGLLAVNLAPREADVVERLSRIKEHTGQAKSTLQSVPNALLQGYSMAVLGMPLLLEVMPGLSRVLRTVNLGVSNVSPPRGSNYLGKPLFLRGARLLGLYTQPILPPSVLLNVTAASFDDSLCLGIASTPDAVADPMDLAEKIEAALNELAEASGVNGNQGKYKDN